MNHEDPERHGRLGRHLRELVLGELAAADADLQGHLLTVPRGRGPHLHLLQRVGSVRLVPHVHVVPHGLDEADLPALEGQVQRRLVVQVVHHRRGLRLDQEVHHPRLPTAALAEDGRVVDVVVVLPGPSDAGRQAGPARRQQPHDLQAASARGDVDRLPAALLVFAVGSARRVDEPRRDLRGISVQDARGSSHGLLDGELG
mmetsp:Transcript_33939/g.89985  ORF Transcript_33939/g.89985 Transcript_33939/m.89985 type:complete len:201 (+) Transcript_33939:284-886(+)